LTIMEDEVDFALAVLNQALEATVTAT